MQSGYVKLWRKSMSNGIMQNANLWLFWCWCLMKATHCERKTMVGHQEVILQPGQFVFGRKKAACELPLSEQQIRSSIESLSRMRNIVIKSTNKFSIISIVNWETYQESDFQINQQINQQITNKQPTNNHKQECKECKEDTLTSSGDDGGEQIENKKAKIPYQDIVDLFNEFLPELPEVRFLNETRKMALKGRWLTDEKTKCLDWWKEYFLYIKESDFLMGRKSKWQCCFDWILKPANFIKIREGSYENR